MDKILDFPDLMDLMEQNQWILPTGRLHHYCANVSSAATRCLIFQCKKTLGDIIINMNNSSCLYFVRTDF